MNERTYSKNIADAIHNVLTEDNWRFSFDEKQGLFKFNLTVKGKIKKISYGIGVQENEYLVYGISPLGADNSDDKMMASMAEFICRANYGLNNGNFELDMRDGEIRYKIYVDCRNITPSPEIVKRSIQYPAAMFERYGEGIVDIIFGNRTAKEAVEECEMSAEARADMAEMMARLARGENIDVMRTRLAARLGLAESGAGEGEKQEAPEGKTEVKTELFGAEGGDA